MNNYKFEYTNNQDQYFNYCLWPYIPVSAVENKFRSVNLLLNSFEVAELPNKALNVVASIRKNIGIFRTVWGIKWLQNKLAWEFYFYDYQRWERDVSMTKVFQAIKPYINCEINAKDEIPYFMFSIDIDKQILANSKLEKINMYIGNPGSNVSSGISYSVGVNQTQLENFYFFFDAKKQLEDAAAKIACSAYLDGRAIDINKILLPEFRECKTICVANKRNHDTIYFSEVNVEQLLLFLQKFHYPLEIINFVKSNKTLLDHMLYDIGFDYKIQDEDLIIIKSGYYGIF